MHGGVQRGSPRGERVAPVLSPPVKGIQRPDNVPDNGAAVSGDRSTLSAAQDAEWVAHDCPGGDWPKDLNGLLPLLPGTDS